MDYNSIYKSQCNNLYNKLIAQNKDLITLFTPTYNRAKFLTRLYECMLKQTNKDFVWIIVKDGSTDNTDDIVMELMGREELPVKYISKSNGGKHTAFKVALENCETEYFQCMDDDDIYFQDAMEFFHYKWREIKDKGYTQVGAIRTLARKPDGTYKTNFSITKNNYGTEYIATTLENNYVYHKIQENWTCYLTSALRDVELFPKKYWLFCQHKFFTEGIWQGRFARKFSCLYVLKAFREYHEDDEYSLMRQPKSRQFYVDRFINSKMILDEQYDYISKRKIELFKRCLTLNWVRAHIGIKFSELLKETASWKLKLYYCLSYPTTMLSSWYIKRMV